MRKKVWNRQEKVRDQVKKELMGKVDEHRAWIGTGGWDVVVKGGESQG